jgi:outer membrane protein insertion porin family
MRGALTAALAVLLASTAVAQQGEEPAVRIRQLTLIGETGLSTREERGVLEEIKKLEYDSNFADEVAARVRFALQDRGYFKSEVDALRITVVRNQQNSKTVDVVVPVHAGALYRVGSINFDGETAFSSNDLRSQFLITDGEIFNRTKVGQGLENLRKLYCGKGYINFTSVPDTHVNESIHIVSFLVSIDEGKLYKFGKLTVTGEESVAGAKQRLLNAWKAYEGKPYDCSGDTLKPLLHDLHIRPGVNPYDFLQISQDNNTGLVELQIRLARPAFPIKSVGNGFRSRH